MSFPQLAKDVSTEQGSSRRRLPVALPQDVLLSKQEETRLRTALQNSEERLENRSNDILASRQDAGLRVESADKHAQDVAFRLRLERQRADMVTKRLDVGHMCNLGRHSAQTCQL